MRPIDADELKDGFNTHFVSEKYGYEKIDVREVIERIDAMPTLDDAPALARWKKAGGYGCYCSICGQRV